MAIQILRAITQHVNYVQMVRRCLVKKSETAQCCDHSSCQFGLWYENDGSDLIQGMGVPEATALWTEIGQHHEAFHRTSIAAVQARGADTQRARQMETAMLQRSTLLVNRLLALDGIMSQKTCAA